VSAGRIVLDEDPSFPCCTWSAAAPSVRSALCLDAHRHEERDCGRAKNRTLAKVTSALLNVTRETDIVGWYLEDQLIGVIARKLGKQAEDGTERMLEKVKAAFIEALPAERFQSPYHSTSWKSGRKPDRPFRQYYAVSGSVTQRRIAQIGAPVKRSMDVIECSCSVLLSRFCRGVSCLNWPRVPCSSGKNAWASTAKSLRCSNSVRCLRLRCPIHEEYVSQFIAGQVDGANQGSEK
jgi:hypothetical protein